MGADPGPIDARLVALARDGERTARRVGELETLLRQVADDVSALVEPADGDEDGAGAAGPRSWLAADDPTTAATDLTGLAEWLGAVYLRYSGAALPSCWAWHPAVVEELWWLRGAHHDAYSGSGASWQRVADWHDRQRPGVVTRIRDAVGGCELALHVPGAEQDQTTRTTPLASAADAIADAWTHERARPEPTTDQLTEAARHDRTEHARNHR